MSSNKPVIGSLRVHRRPIRYPYPRAVFGGALAALLLAVACSACSGGKSGMPTGDEVGPIEAAYMLNADIVSAADRLKEETIQTCMAEQGFRYDVSLISPATAAQLAITQHFDNQLILEEWYGFHDLRDFSSPPATVPDPNQPRVEAMDDSERAAYLQALTVSTPSTPSCASRGESAASAAIVGPATQHLGELYGDLMVRVRTDSRVMKAQTAWQECIRAAGFTYRSRDDVIADLKGEAERANSQTDPTKRADALQSLQAHAEQLAATDVGCDESAGLERVTHEVQLAAEKKLAEAEAPLLDEVARERTALVGSEGA